MFGLLLVDKPSGMTSHDVVDRVRRVAGLRAVGHAGTLDPFATGLLILGLGKATKWLNHLQGLDKTYEATAMLGATSDTFDREGVITQHATSHMPHPKAEDIEKALSLFRGGYEQKAPLHSAKKIGGKKLYELARAGTASEEMRPVKRVTITQLEITEYNWPILRFTVACSSGTYIRSLADDLGRALGVGAYLTELRRTTIGAYRVDQALSLEKITKQSLETALLSSLDIT